MQLHWHPVSLFSHPFLFSNANILFWSFALHADAQSRMFVNGSLGTIVTPLVSLHVFSSATLNQAISYYVHLSNHYRRFISLHLWHFMIIVSKIAFITNFAKFSIGVSWTVTSGRTFKVSACSAIVTYIVWVGACYNVTMGCNY